MTYRVARQYALIEDGSASRVLVSEDRAVLNDPGRQRKMLLAGGFSSATGELSCPQSAALQLNGDLTDMGNDQLQRFAAAELEKQNSISFRSYDVDADYRVCAIADDPRRLDRFIEAYSGILEIEALLIGSYHRAYETVQEIDISPAARGYAITYTVKSPINRSRCTYCGICGAVCPEQCIHENLRFDFNRCTYCTDCEKACPSEAVDLHSIERISMEIPALIILGDPAIKGPDNTEFLYRESQIADYLATIYSCRVDEAITCDHAICHYNGGENKGCTACLAACRFGAVKAVGKEINVDALACSECGACTAVCPTGAMQDQNLTDRMFVEFFRTFELVPGSRVIIGSDRSLHRFWWRNNQKLFRRTLFFEMPSDQSVSLMHLLFLLSHGARQIDVLGSNDSSGAELQRTVREANRICGKTLGSDRAVSIVSDYDAVPEHAAEPASSPQAKRYRDLSFVNRRRKLSSIVQHLALLASSPVLFADGEVRFWGTIICDDTRCTQCLACLNVCRIESLTGDQHDLSLCWNGGLCVGCGGCVATCPEQALSLRPNAGLVPEFFTDRELSRAEPMRCSGCGKVFGTRRSFDRVMAILTEKQGAPPAHLNYCEDCRILRLMESE